MTTETLNAIEYEIIRNRLLSITDEMRIALQSVSGSPTVTEATDFYTGLFLPNAEFVTMGFQVTHDAPPVSDLIRFLIGRRNVAINPGDIFIGNDPFIGSLHQNDMQMVAPIFYEGALVAWAGVMAHETDVGGMDFASWSPKARDMYQEGMRIPGVKLVDRGDLREDVLEFILAASRLPDALGLDIRAFIATLNVASDRVEKLIDRYDAAVFQYAMSRMIDESEQRLRSRLRELPDGVFRASDFLEHDGHENRLYKIDLVMTKQGGKLTLDFNGSSGQAPGFINATRPGLRGGVAAAVISMLAWDIPWNEGLMRCVEIVARDGLICTAQPPAPVGAATVETMWVVGNVTANAFNKLLGCSHRYRHRSRAVSCGTMATFNMGGVNQFGERFGLHLIDPLANGFGACGDKDGIDAAGPIWVPMPAIADVEKNELVSPLLYLYRRLRQDSGGPGKFRGGRGAEMAVTLCGIEKAEILVMTHGAEVPNSAGIFGGWPGAVVTQRLGRDVLDDGAFPAGRLPDEVRDLGGDWQDFGPKPGLMPFGSRDVFAAAWQGGGGWGDPLERDPESVLEDVLLGVVSESAAKDIYGVAISDRKIIPDTTRGIRRNAGSGAEPGAIIWLGEKLKIEREGEDLVVKSRSGAVLSTNTTAWEEGAVSRRLSPAEIPGNIRLHEQLAMTGLYCPRSMELLDIRVHRIDEQPHAEILIELEKIV